MILHILVMSHPSGNISNCFTTPNVKLWIEVSHEGTSEVISGYNTNFNKASQAIQSPRTVPFFLLVSLLDGYSFPNVLVKGIVAFKH